MDALALLCNLHADGPATLSILRQVGYDTLDDIREAKPEDLEALLGVTPRLARRIQQEAGILSARLDERPEARNGRGLLESLVLEETDPLLDGDHGEEEDAKPLAPALDATLDDEGEFLDDDDDEEEFEEFEEEEYEEEDECEEEEYEEEEYEEEESVPAILAENSEKITAAVKAAAEHEAPAVETDDEHDDDPGEGATRFPLVPGSFEGLTGLLADKLVHEGIETIGDFVNGDPLEISEKIGLGYTRLLRLQFLARRHLRSLDRAAVRDVEIVPPPPPSEGRLEASGPFA